MSSNVTLYTGPELGRLAEGSGERNVHGGYNWDTRVRNRSAKYTVIVGSAQVQRRKMGPEQQETLRGMDREFARVFGGPHSYAGIFDQPHAEDAQRFIQAALAKRYNTVFLDHFKNYYFDWDIRVPGMAYLPDPFHFDRFWVGALARHSEALLHLSWNEWWEGANLEPCHDIHGYLCR